MGYQGYYSENAFQNSKQGLLLQKQSVLGLRWLSMVFLAGIYCSKFKGENIVYVANNKNADQKLRSVASGQGMWRFIISNRKNA